MIRSFLRWRRKRAALHMPVNRGVIRDDQEKYRYPVRSIEDHLKEAMEWMNHAQRATPDKGMSAGYSMLKGSWLPSYPETTGYVISTFFDYARRTGYTRWKQQATDMGEFLLEHQDPQGAFPGGLIGEGRGPAVFNAGQIITGLCRLFQETRDSKYLEAARRAARWIVSVQDPDGAWRKFTYRDQVHTYYSMVAAALLQLIDLDPAPEWMAAVENHGTWVVQQQQPNGWFRHSAFDRLEIPLTHTIGYTLQGLLELGSALGREEWIRSVERAAEVLMNQLDGEGRLGGQFDADWRSIGDFSCLTGNCQIALVWMKLAHVRKRADMAAAAVRILRFVASTQLTSEGAAVIRGGIKGSDPIWGEYQTYVYPNWAAKFFADALMRFEEMGRTSL